MVRNPLIGLVAGEASGDLLGHALMQGLQQLYPDVRFVGVGGSHMQQAGLHAIGSMETLSVMGFIEPLKKLPQIWRLRQSIVKKLTQCKPDCFIGIDAPDFNLGLEKILRRSGIKTAHMVSPTVWAWRESRIHRIKQAIDMMMLIYPFEQAIYDKHHIKARFIGHPLAESLDFVSDQATCQATLKLPSDKKIIGLLPGSRAAEIRYLGEPFIKTALWLNNKRNDLFFVIPCVNSARRQQLEALLSHWPTLKNVCLFDGQSEKVITASDAVLLVSGTSALQTALLRRPYVCAYKMSPMTFQIAKRLVKVKHISMPNILLDREVAPEFIQHQIEPQKMGACLLDYLDSPERVQPMLQAFDEIRASLQQDSGLKAAKAVAELLEER